MFLRFATWGFILKGLCQPKTLGVIFPDRLYPWGFCLTFVGCNRRAPEICPKFPLNDRRCYEMLTNTFSSYPSLEALFFGKF